MGYRLRYEILNHDLADPYRDVEVEATQTEIRSLTVDGFLVRERIVQGELLESLRQGVDALEEAERQDPRPGEGYSDSRRYGGLFMRWLFDRHPAFLPLLEFPPFLSVARAMLGPQVQIRGMTARISYPNKPNQETHWHQHHRVIPRPLPPWFVRPHSVDVLLYLDDLNDANGPVVVLPGSHDRILEDLAPDSYGDFPGQKVLRLPAGSAVITHAGLWHRAMPTTAQGIRRRLVIIGYAPTWMREAPYGVRDMGGLSKKMREEGDGPSRELLGNGGYT